ncbi:MAG: aminodeoxychorismate synthase component I [Candidatus Omnitrophica bacterium]|nr:aminodeoxychorismate synthase component I [Candidatus Omnitrophota bacterium]MDD5436432.1 aminodeoxychorismate synthase component I [Candidatus Omnitrophota bacterium]
MADTIIDNITAHRSPAELFSTLASYPYVFFLDSSLRNRNLGRFSFLGCDPFLVFKSKGDSILLDWADGRKESFKADPFAALRDIFKRYSREETDKRLPFTSGGVGYFSYDMKDFTERLPDIAARDLDLPDCVMGFYDTVIICDHLRNKTYIASSGLPCGGSRGKSRRSDRLKRMKERIEKSGDDASSSASQRGKRAAAPRSNISRSAYIGAVEKAKRYIKKGDIYQVNLSQRFEAGLSMDPAQLYLKLRSVSPAPFASYLGFGDLAILSSSPERFLLKKGRHIETRPIKGTRPRGRTPESDRALERELKKSAKDNAEHIMIVDLERNDLGRVCDYGSVKLSGPPAIEKYANVFHMVSTVSGILKKGTGPIDCLLAAFPGGSITGAPKVRSMEIIEELEPVKRSIYTGAVGYISFSGDMDTSIVIRTLLAKGKKAYFSVGGGIVADSDPEAEYQETLDKAAGIIHALDNK